MQIKTEQKNGILIIYLMERHLDSAISSEFRERIIDYVNEGNKRIIINLKAVEYIDSSGLGSLVLGHKEVRKIGEMKIASLHPQIQHIINLVRLDRVLNVYKNDEEALSSFND